MPTLKYLGVSYDCTTAIKGPDYIHLLDANGVMVATFDKITDFSSFALENGGYTSPTTDHNCYLTVTRDDGTFGKGSHTCADIERALNLTAADVGARPNTWTPSAADVGAVPTSRTVNGKALSSNISLTASDVGASASGHKHTKSEITDFPTSMPASDVYSWAKAATKPTYTASEVGAAASSHNHSASEITSGTLPVARGGTGNTSVDTTPTSGSTKMVTSGGVYTALAGKAASSHGNHVPATQTANNAVFLRNDNTWQTVTPANIGAAASSHKHTKSEITDFPTSMTPTAHNQAASTITAGTLAGKVNANATAAATLGNAQVRDIYAGTSDMTAGSSSLTSGTIYFVYE